jgi:hypothetical protein
VLGEDNQAGAAQSIQLVSTETYRSRFSEQPETRKKREEKTDREERQREGERRKRERQRKSRETETKERETERERREPTTGPPILLPHSKLQIVSLAITY